MVRHCQYANCNGDACRPEQINTSNDVEAKMWPFPDPKKRWECVHRMDQGLQSGPRWAELTDRVPKR